MEQSTYATSASSVPSDKDRATPQELYNDLGKTYEDAYSHNKGQAQSLQWLIAQLPKGATVLDLGCGTGVPASKTLSNAGLAVTGVDISHVMLSHAQASVPAATFIEADLLTFTPESSFDAVVAYFSLIGHLSQEQIREVLVRIHDFLKPGGYFVYGTVPLEGDGVKTLWLGKEFLSSSFDTENSVAAVEGAGFEVLKFEEVVFDYEHGQVAEFGWAGEVVGEPHLFVYAKKGSE